MGSAQTKAKENTVVSSWSTDDLPANERLENWSEVLSESHLPWTIADSPQGDFSANVNVRSFNDYKLMSCGCDEMSGYRNEFEIGNTDDSYFCILLLRQGQERVTVCGEDLYLDRNDMILWDSTKKMSFHISKHIEKTSLLFPSTALTSVFPNMHDLAGKIIQGNAGLGSMLARHLESLHQEMWHLDTSSLTALMRPTMEILATTLTGEQTFSPASLREFTLKRVKGYIRQNLRDPRLNTKHISEQVGISTRYLHLLFETEQTTVSAWIKKCRLHQCKDEICSPIRSNDTITSIAYKWGFNDSSHFSKSFKKEFGHSPRDYMQIQQNAEFQPSSMT